MIEWTKVREVKSKDENVKKYVFEKGDAVAESVLYKYPTYEERTVICCSTQSGCPVGCRFCGAGDNFVRSLTASEIVSQSVHLLESNGIYSPGIKRFQIMFMSMGEPMLNFKELKEAIGILYVTYPNARLLISTSAPRVDYSGLVEISKLIPTVGLQFSIHESTDEARNRLIPFSHKLNLKTIAEVGVWWARETRRRPFFNYCVHDKNNTPEDVKRLVELFDPSIWESTISVICERDESVSAANQRQRKLATDFMGLMNEAGFSTRCFDPAGQDDIGGGCGQLWFVQDWIKKNGSLARPSVGFGKPSIHTPREIQNAKA